MWWQQEMHHGTTRCQECGKGHGDQPLARAAWHGCGPPKQEPGCQQPHPALGHGASPASWTDDQRHSPAMAMLCSTQPSLGTLGCRRLFGVLLHRGAQENIVLPGGPTASGTAGPNRSPQWRGAAMGLGFNQAKHLRFAPLRMTWQDGHQFHGLGLDQCHARLSLPHSRRCSAPSTPSPALCQAADRSWLRVSFVARLCPML